MDKHLHIIALNVPYPPNYGGVIDIYYKVKALHKAGVRIILHCFEYERPQAIELESLCEKVYYYKRHTGVITNITLLPYNVYGRKSEELLANLLQDNYPILFEGLHSCYHLKDKRLADRMKIARIANIEHDYYHHISSSEKHPLRKMFYTIEAWRFKRYQPVIRHADLIIAVSGTDTEYLRKLFPGKRIEFIPCFHANNHITALPGQSSFLLYHGKLSVVENEHAALYLIKEVFRHVTQTCVIAGMNPSTELVKAAAPYSNIHIEANPTEERMNYLIREAQAHVLVTFQGTGLKLKLLNSLFAGRHVIANRTMLTGSGLDSLCHIADTADEQIRTCKSLAATPFTQSEIEIRKKSLIPYFSNTYQGELLLKMIYGNE